MKELGYKQTDIVRSKTLQHPHFDDIVLSILPFLKNGRTPENQTILGILEDIAEHTGEDRWRLKREGQGELFN